MLDPLSLAGHPSGLKTGPDRLIRLLLREVQGYSPPLVPASHQPQELSRR